MKITRLDKNMWASDAPILATLKEHLCALLAEHSQNYAPLLIVIEAKGGPFPLVLTFFVRVKQGCVEVVGFIAIDSPETEMALGSKIYGESNAKTLEDLAAIINFHGLDTVEVLTVGTETERQAHLFSSLN